MALLGRTLLIVLLLLQRGDQDEQKAGTGGGATGGRATGGGRTFIASLVVFVFLAFSDDALEVLFDVLNRAQPRWALVVADASLLLIVFVTLLTDRRGRPWGTFAVGAVVTLAADWWTERVPTAVAVLLYALGLLLVVSAILRFRFQDLRGGPERRHAAWTRLLPVLPLLLGTVAAWIGSSIYVEELQATARRVLTEDVEAADLQGAVSQEYFAQLSQVIPLILVGVGIEGRYFQHLLAEPTERALITLTICLLVAAEGLAITALAEDNAGDGDLLYVLHEYSAFVLTLEASIAGLVLLVMALLQRRS